MNPLRILAAIYAVLFAIVTSLNYIPGLADAQGRTFGLFELDIFDDVLHAASGAWAALAAWWSIRATIIFFRVFGTLQPICWWGSLAMGGTSRRSRAITRSWSPSWRRPGRCRRSTGRESYSRCRSSREQPAGGSASMSPSSILPR